MKTKLLLACMLICLIACAPVQTPPGSPNIVTGIVFNDLNHNGLKDTRERGIAGVAVSNQHEVTLTDRHGRYRLPISERNIIFVTKPAGWMTPLDANNLPRFYKIHQPTGSPAGLKYPGIEPTGSLPASVDFALERASRPEGEFTMVAMGDPQFEDMNELGYFAEDIVAEIPNNDYRFILTLGDLVDEALELYVPYKQVMARAECPVYNMAGNNDGNYDAKDDSNSLETYKRNFGPPFYSFDYGRVHFVVLDDIEHIGDGKSGYKHRLGEGQLEWLKNDLARVSPDKLVVLAAHHAVMRCEDTGSAFEILRDHPRMLSLAGHMHVIQQDFAGPADGWHGELFHQIVCGATCGEWWGGPLDRRGIPISDTDTGSPMGYFVIQFKGNEYTTRYKVAGCDASYRIRISRPTLFVSDDDPSTQVVANVFGGSPRSRVECSIDGQSWQTMEKTFMPDPHMTWVYAQFSPIYSDWTQKYAKPCNHLWTAPLPVLGSGIHRVTVRVKDSASESYDAERLFTVAPKSGDSISK